MIDDVAEDAFGALARAASKARGAHLTLQNDLQIARERIELLTNLLASATPYLKREAGRIGDGSIVKFLVHQIETEVLAEGRYGIWWGNTITGKGEWLRYVDRDGSPGTIIEYPNKWEAEQRCRQKRSTVAWSTFEPRPIPEGEA